MPPASPPPPFPPPTFLKARWVSGFVQGPKGKESGKDSADEKGADPLDLLWNVSSSADCTVASAGAPELSRVTSLAGNILLVEEGDNGDTRAYWLQRKISKTSHGSVRVGFELKRADNEDGGANWEIKESNGIYPFEMVAVKIQDRSKLFDDEEGNGRDPNAEFSALQMVAAHDPEGLGHVVVSKVATCQNNIFTIMPYHREGTLLDYCSAHGRLQEGLARHFFRQLLQGLQTLKQVELCHRNLSLDTILLRGQDCNISRLALSLQIPKSQDTDTTLLMEPQPGLGRYAQFLAPEVLKGEPFDGYAVDLWAAGVILFCMLVGSDALFAAPLQEDRRFQEMCVKGKLKEAGKKWEAKQSDTEPLSDEAWDLLQRMLKAAPKSRPNLSEVSSHLWVLGKGEDDVVLPSYSTKK